jgi:hypothetical protein
MTESDKALAKLREPFPDNQINLLPKQMKREDQDKGKCEPRSRYSGDGQYCGGWHARSIHLSYVGHAALTDRFLDVDPLWSWEPVAFDQSGLPAFDREGGLWIRLTICGVTRLGYGDAQGKKGPNAIKEAIGDALRNAGMRFGAALDLWHKGDLHDAQAEQGSETAPTPEPVAAPAPEPLSQEVLEQIDDFRLSIESATTATEMNAIAADIAKSPITGPARDDLRRLFSAKSKEVLG